MVQRIGGFRRKTRSKLKKPHRQRGKISIRKYFQKYKEGDKVTLKAEPAIQGGMAFPRFHGKTGTVVGKQGKCYKIRIRDGKMAKEVVVHPVHLNKEEK